MVEGRSPTKLDEPFHHAAGSVQAPFFFHHPPTLLLECAHRRCGDCVGADTVDPVRAAVKVGCDLVIFASQCGALAVRRR